MRTQPTFRLHHLHLVFFLVLLLCGCRTTAPREPVLAASSTVRSHKDEKAADELFTEFGGEEAFLQTVHYLYRWNLDEDDFKRRDASLQGQLWLRHIQTLTDANDNSRFLEVVFPAIGVAVRLKKTDYRIPELKLDVKSGGYRVTGISRTPYTEADARDFSRFDFAPEALYERLFQERLNAIFPDDKLLARMRDSAAREIADLDLPATGKDTHSIYFAPIHTVANEVWAFWEEGKLLFHFTSDIDLVNPDVWSREALGVTIYDTARQTVVSHEERPGDHRFITRDQVGRALYNCIVLGKAVSVPAQKAAPAP
jgi:hypothetical protein